MVAGTLAFLASTATAIAPTVGVASSLYGLGSAIDADNQKTNEANKIKKANAEALVKRKNVIDKQRMQLLGAGDGKYTTSRATGVKNPLAPSGEILG